MKRVITTVPFRGRPLTVAEVEGVQCGVHDLTGQAQFDALRFGLELPNGIDICMDCLRACKEFARQKLSKPKDK